MTRKNNNTDMQTFDIYQEDSPKTKTSEHLSKKRRPNPDDFVRKNNKITGKTGKSVKKEDTGSLVKGILLGLLVAMIIIWLDYAKII